MQRPDLNIDCLAYLHSPSALNILLRSSYAPYLPTVNLQKSLTCLKDGFNVNKTKTQKSYKPNVVLNQKPTQQEKDVNSSIDAHLSLSTCNVCESITVSTPIEQSLKVSKGYNEEQKDEEEKIQLQTSEKVFQSEVSIKEKEKDKSLNRLATSKLNEPSLKVKEEVIIKNKESKTQKAITNSNDNVDNNNFKHNILIISENNKDAEVIQNELQRLNKNAEIHSTSILLIKKEYNNIINSLLSYHFIVISIQTYSIELQHLLELMENKLATIGIDNVFNRKIYVLINNAIDTSQYYFPSMSRVFTLIKFVYEIDMNLDLNSIPIIKPVQSTCDTLVKPMYPYWKPQYKLGVFSNEKEKKTKIIIDMLIYCSSDEIEINPTQMKLSIEELYISIVISGNIKDIEENDVSLCLPINIPKNNIKYCNKEDKEPIIQIGDLTKVIFYLC